jgi:hypothetical protein
MRLRPLVFLAGVTFTAYCGGVARIGSEGG